MNVLKFCGRGATLQNTRSGVSSIGIPTSAILLEEGEKVGFEIFFIHNALTPNMNLPLVGNSRGEVS
jgi:hypothetical protein